MKVSFVLQKVGYTAVAVLFFTTSSDPINLYKLGLKSVAVKNNVQQQQAFTVTFWEKCSGDLFCHS